MIGNPIEIINYLYNLPDKEKQYQIAEYKQPRTLNANGYMWKLCTEIAKVINSTKNEVYRKAVSEVGVYTVVTIENDAVETFKTGWGHDKIGWICEVLGQDPSGNYSDVSAYYGSSTYNTKEMSILVDYIVEEAKELGINTLTPNEIENLKSLWKGR